MATFYQPKETKGFYSAGDRRLTVNVGDDVYIGFRAASQDEEDNAIVSASDNSVLLGRSRIGYLNTEFQIDTSKPGRYTLEAERDDLMMTASTAVAQPLEVYVRFNDFESTSAQGQWNDASGCWAASLIWWLGVLADRPSMDYNSLLLKFAKMWNQDGTININSFRQGVQANNGMFRMRTESINPTMLSSYMGCWPMVIGFKAPGGFGHMNVLYGYDSNAGQVQAMEPWGPDPGDDGITWGDSGPYLNNPDFQFTGKFASRPLSYYGSPAPGNSVLLVGYPQEYALNRMP